MASKDATGEAQRHTIGLATALARAWPPSCDPRAS